MKHIRTFILWISLFMAANANASAALTVLSVKSGLQDIVKELREAMAEATSDLQSLGNSLQANAQNVIRDIDTVLGKKLAYTFNRLDAAELRLVEDAQALIVQTRRATEAIIRKAGDEARLTIVEADIAAYNASYSLPCRDAPPRIVASFPARITVGTTTPLLKLRGNFLRQGNLPTVTINGAMARIVERLDTSITIEIPRTVSDRANTGEVIAAAVIDGLQSIQRSAWMWGLLGCHDSMTTIQAKPIALSILEPPTRYSIEGTMKYLYTAHREVAEPAQRFSNTGSGKCNDNYRVDQQWCLVGEGTIARADVSDVGANCSSGFEGTTASGDRCVLARGKVAGCGAVIGPFNTWLSCKGRGWLHYTITLTRRQPYEAESPPSVINRAGRPGEKSFSFPLASVSGMESPRPQYQVSVQTLKGNRLIESVSLSNANPNSGKFISRISEGVLAIDIND